MTTLTRPRTDYGDEMVWRWRVATGRSGLEWDDLPLAKTWDQLRVAYLIRERDNLLARLRREGG